MKGSMIMTNKPMTSDAIGSTNANLDRKGGRIMSNDHRASDMSGAQVMTGAQIYVGARHRPARRGIMHRVAGFFGLGEMNANLDRKGGKAMSNAPDTSSMTGAAMMRAAMASPATQAKVSAAAMIDTRIKAVSVPYFATAYEGAVSAEDLATYYKNCTRVMAGFLDADGVKNFGKIKMIEAQFGSAQNFERAVVKRLMERGKYLGAY